MIAVVSGGLIGLFVGIANGIVQRKHGGWAGFFLALLWGVIVSILVGLLIQDYITSEPLRFAVIGMCAVISEDIVTGLRTFGISVRTDPFGTIVRVFDALRAATVKRKESD